MTHMIPSRQNCFPLTLHSCAYQNPFAHSTYFIQCQECCTPVSMWRQKVQQWGGKRLSPCGEDKESITGPTLKEVSLVQKELDL